MNETSTQPLLEGEAASPRWTALSDVQRRVVGVLVEKAKTTPEQYPLSHKAIVTASNQKSNRFPQMELDGDDVQSALDQLRTLGAVVEIQSGGRVAKYKHLLYEWLGVDKVELAIVAELLLRGAQTVGELRGRAARMEPIADLAALQPILESLREKDLLVELSPPGRGQVVTHNLYQADELQRLRKEQQGVGGGQQTARPTTDPAAPGWRQLAEQVEELSARVERLEARLDQLSG